MTTFYHKPLPTVSGIYRITCTVTGLVYIGSANNLRRRSSQHLSALRRNKHGNQKLQRAWNKYTESTFRFEIIEFVLSPFLLEREQYWLDKIQPFGENGFNIARFAQASRLGITPSPETREKLRIANLGKPSPTRGKKISPERIARLREFNMGNTYCLGKKHTLEARENMRLAHLGQVSHFKGKKHAPETIVKMKAAQKGKTPSHLHTPEVRAKIAAAQIGHEVRPETREKLRDINLGKKHTPEVRAKISEAGRGRKHSPETREKLHIARLGNTHCAKDYIVTSPEGVEYTVHNLTEFCQEHQLTQQALSSVASGKRKHHKGWTACYPDTHVS